MTRSTGKEPSGLARSCGPLLNTTSTSPQQAASASTMDHLEQQRKTMMRRGIGPGASDGASTGQERAAVARQRLMPNVVVLNPIMVTTIADEEALPINTARTSSPGAPVAVT